MALSAPAEWHAFGRRVLGAARLDSASYREVSRDRNALPQAVAVILLTSLASAAVYLIDGTSPGLSIDLDWARYPVTRESDAAIALAGGILDASWGLVVWAIHASIIWVLWNRLDGGRKRPRSWHAIATPIGFANAPLIVVPVLGLIPVVGGVLTGAGFIWLLATELMAIREALAIGWARALLYLVVSTVAMLPLALILSRLT